jgi:predicted short-subunit dehydrogenase-like oxidoreductase (DUF2520 family)
MKSRHAMGLVSAGGASQSFLARWPALLAQLGPIKASSFQVARRLANTLHAGYAVSHYSALEFCPLIWIVSPESGLERVIRDLASQTPMHRTMVVLCGVVRDSLPASPLRKRGARIASLNAVETGRDAQPYERLFVGEGDPDALRLMRRLLAADGRKMIEIRPAAKPLYFAGVHLATHLLLPFVSASVEVLRAAGLTRPEATRLAEHLAARAVRAYSRAGRKAWNRSAANTLRRALESDVETVRAADKRWGVLYAEGIRRALAYFDGSEDAAGAG